MHNTTDVPYSFRNDFVNAQFHNYPTRQANNLYPPLYKTTHGQFSI